MTPQEKAAELIRKYYTFGINKEGQTLSWLESKQCALIAVDEIIKSNPRLPHTLDWQQVKTEIENL